jgi:signal transduction histidine kinase
MNQILDFAKLQAGSLALDLSDTTVGRLIAGMESLVSPQAAAKGVTLASIQVASDTTIRTDASRVTQVLANLAGNAVKFTPRGGHIVVRVDESPERIAIAVRDDGVGIPHDMQERIFEPFVQVPIEGATSRDGVGLGLAISRDLARRLGGEITVDSTPGQGSTFTLTLPRR